MAYMLNIPLMTTVGAGERAAAAPFGEVNRDNVMVEVVKQQLDGEDTIIRLYEFYGRRAEVTMKLADVPESVKLVNLLEDELEDVAFDGREVRFGIKPYEILTFKIK